MAQCQLCPENDLMLRAINWRDVPCEDGSQLARASSGKQHWSVQPCVRPLAAVHTTAGQPHLPSRGSINTFDPRDSRCRARGRPGYPVCMSTLKFFRPCGTVYYERLGICAKTIAPCSLSLQGRPSDHLPGICAIQISISELRMTEAGLPR